MANVTLSIDDALLRYPQAGADQPALPSQGLTQGLAQGPGLERRAEQAGQQVDLDVRAPLPHQQDPLDAIPGQGHGQPPLLHGQPEPVPLGPQPLPQALCAL